VHGAVAKTPKKKDDIKRVQMDSKTLPLSTGLTEGCTQAEYTNEPLVNERGSNCPRKSKDKQRIDHQAEKRDLQLTNESTSIKQTCATQTSQTSQPVCALLI
jgi:hypothetical protein